MTTATTTYHKFEARTAKEQAEPWALDRCAVCGNARAFVQHDDYNRPRQMTTKPNNQQPVATDEWASVEEHQAKTCKPERCLYCQANGTQPPAPVGTPELELIVAAVVNELEHGYGVSELVDYGAPTITEIAQKLAPKFTTNQHRIAELEAALRDCYQYLSKIPATYENGTLLGRVGRIVDRAVLNRKDGE